jgi:hypothetical protein
LAETERTRNGAAPHLFHPTVDPAPPRLQELPPLGVLALHQLCVQLAPAGQVEQPHQLVVVQRRGAERALEVRAQHLGPTPVGEAPPHLELQQAIGGQLVAVAKEQVFVALGVDVRHAHVVDDDLDARRVPAVGLRVAATTGDQEHQGETEPDY